jgi:mono/diheme cytochrome c family protein
MKLSLQIKGIILGTLSSLVALSIAFAAGEMFRPKATAASIATEGLVIPPAGTQERQGHDLFMMNCAHCHGNDARGDEGPDLHGLAKSDARISSLIKNGIKGEMPKFGAKLTDRDVQALVAFLRSLDRQTPRPGSSKP